MFRYFITAAPTLPMLMGVLLVTGLVSRADAAEANAEANTEANTEAAVAAIREIGGTVHPSGDDNQSWEVEFHLSGRDLTDDGLMRVAALKNVVLLNLRDTKITSGGLVHLRGLEKLRRLHLERTEVGDEGFESLAGLTNLEYLNLYETKITDKSLGYLRGLKKLRNLYVWQTGVTDQGVARLEKALPGLTVVRGVDLSKIPAITRSEPAKPSVRLKWIATSDAKDAPKSVTGLNTEVVFENKSARRVKIYWVSYGSGELKIYGELAPGETRRQNTYARNTWLITDQNDKPLGYFTVAEEVSLAVIPKQK